MVHIVRLSVFFGVLLSFCAVSFCAEYNRRAVSGKQFYSNRPSGYIVTSPYYGTPVTPRFMLPPEVPDEVLYEEHKPELAPIVAPVPVSPPAPVTRNSMQTPAAEEKTTYVLRDAKQEVNVNDELDAFQARLAKIQLEKHQLAEALNLVQKIKSDTFKVRTLVDLAEYVSRDKNYQREAEQLYRLAIAGMEALDRKLPFNVNSGMNSDNNSNAAVSVSEDPIILPSESVSESASPSFVSPPPKRTIVLDDPAPAAEVSADPPAESSAKPQPIPLDDESPSSVPVKAPVRRKPILLLDENPENTEPETKEEERALLPPPNPPQNEKNTDPDSSAQTLTFPEPTDSVDKVEEEPNPELAPIKRPQPAIVLEDQPEEPKPEAKPAKRRLAPILLD